MPDFTVYAGLSGDTDPGRFWSAGLYRSRNAEGAWESIGGNIGVEPHVFAILADPRAPGRVTIGTADGIFRTDDAGDTWRRLSVPKPGLAVWSLSRDPRRPDTLYAGYEPCQIYRSTDDGKTWEKLGADAPGFPAVSAIPEIPKRVISIAVDPADTTQIYAAIEVGGLLRSLDGGKNFENVIDGIYFDEGFVDVHSVVVNPDKPGQVTIATRYGTFRSEDRGAHWRDLKVPMLRTAGTYSRVLRYAPGDASTLYLAGGNDFDGDRGGLFISRDNAASWQKAETGVALKTSCFGLAVDPNQPDSIFFATKIGQLVYSFDRGRTWASNPLPSGVGHLFSLAVGWAGRLKVVLPEPGRVALSGEPPPA